MLFRKLTLFLGCAFAAAMPAAAADAPRYSATWESIDSRPTPGIDATGFRQPFAP